MFFTNSFTLSYTKLLWNINIKYTISEETVEHVENDEQGELKQYHSFIFINIWKLK